MSRALTAAEGGTDQPQDEQDDCDDPQHVEGEPSTKEDQDEKESKEEEHALGSTPQVGRPNGTHADFYLES